MPELPEVERTRELLREHCEGRTAERVEVVLCERKKARLFRSVEGITGEGRRTCRPLSLLLVRPHQDSIVFQGPDTTPDGFAAHVRGRTVTGIGRRGKYPQSSPMVIQLLRRGPAKVLWLELDKPPHVVCHLGMTGYVSIENVDGVPYRQAKKEPAAWPEEKPKYWKFVIAFAKGTSETQPLRIAFCDARRLDWGNRHPVLIPAAVNRIDFGTKGESDWWTK
ncbi:MAG: hypothetical protein BJ554DRAFT_2472 [Olpidium bornovanus]|uniref:Formamidopyrimidine-DNA glycosylase catalytic domain-containing protein n=1 Tax=Olpidium bornovanus TaxID=278681 RepID=A0A8H8DMW9_9FUNG|nr:MAG: hypothetical protein BJ554DRAFT_2472 [Olpidium bornovanus]